MQNKSLLSVIVPAYKQENTIKKDLENIDRVLQDGLKDADYEIICVVDGFIDKTFEKAQTAKCKNLTVVGYPINKGKGYAVRYGMVRSKGDLVSFLDSGMDISPKGIMMLMAHMDWYNADIIVGSKRHPVSRVNYPLLRRIFSIGYHFGAKVLFGLPLTDTQSGIKIFKREVLEQVLPRLLVKRYAMDIEMLAVAKYLGFSRIYEAPIEVIFDQRTSSIKWSTTVKMALDTIAVFYRLKILNYYANSNQRKWHFDPELQFNVNVG
jgi:glycosyltransferase involved in cell wall biosynthesis